MPSRNQRGGYTEGQAYKNDKHRIWTNYFLKKNSGSPVIIDSVPEPTGAGKRYIYIIDMQYDFIDQPFTEKDGTEPVMGKFAVGDGKEVIQKIVDYLGDGSRYEKEIFSRDYHPTDHCSFFNGPGARGGNFPSHCVQGTKGTEIVDPIKNVGKDHANAIVVFKGMHPDVDSFTAASFDSKQGSSGIGCTGCGENGVSCSAITGAYTLPDAATDAWNFDGELTQAEAVKFELNPPDGSVIEVCGLAGDYCVRDTAIALKTLYPACTVVVLGDLVRYPFLPLIVPIVQHRNKLEGSVSIDNHTANLPRFLNVDDPNKGLNYYLFDKDGLVAKENLPDLPTLSANLDKYFHFISDPRAMVEDYSDVGVKLVAKPITAGGKRRVRKTKKRHGKKRQTRRR
jgi:nicotinamidase-related amidase